MNMAIFQPPGINLNGNRRVLVVSDTGESLQRIRSVLVKNEVEITLASSPEEMCRGCCGWNDLVVVDIDPKRLTEILETLRGCAGCTKIPVLVEASRISADPSLAGLLQHIARCRAMPQTCSHFHGTSSGRKSKSRDGENCSDFLESGKRKR